MTGFIPNTNEGKIPTFFQNRTMTTLSLDFTTEEASALSNWTRKAGFSSDIETIRNALQLVGAIPKEADYFDKLFSDAPKRRRK